MKRSMFSIIYIISAILLVGVVLYLFGNVIAGDWLTMSQNWAALFPYLVGLALASYWFIRRRG